MSQEDKFINPRSLTLGAASEQFNIVKSHGLQFTPRIFVNNTPTTKDVLRQQDNSLASGQANAHLGDFNLPVFDILTLGDKDGMSFDAVVNGTLRHFDLETLDLGLVLIDITMTKNIITTSIAGRNGTIKEYASDGDYIIDIKGVLSTNAQYTFPEDAMTKLNNYCLAPTSIKVSSNVLARFGITELVITNLHFGQSEAMRNIQRFTINALSETAYEIKSSDPSFSGK
jgi:hypothetical protein